MHQREIRDLPQRFLAQHDVPLHIQMVDLHKAVGIQRSREYLPINTDVILVDCSRIRRISSPIRLVKTVAKMLLLKKKAWNLCYFEC
jgi:hypothetical protein